MTDPAVQAVADALCQPHGEHYTRYIDPDPSQRPRALETAQVAVDAYRRHVLASRPDAERWESAQGELSGVLACDDPDWKDAWLRDHAADLLAALADETARAQTWEAAAHDTTRAAGRTPEDSEASPAAAR